MSDAMEPNSWSSDTLFAKAQLYIDKMYSTVAISDRRLKAFGNRLWNRTYFAWF
jgi:hypothetical protein